MFCFSLSDTALHTSPASPWAKDTTEDKETIVPTLELKVERLVQKHRVDLNRSLVGALSPWQVASAWVTSRQIIPDFAPRLGKLYFVLFIIFLDFINCFSFFFLCFFCFFSFSFFLSSSSFFFSSSSSPSLSSLQEGQANFMIVP